MRKALLTLGILAIACFFGQALAEEGEEAAEQRFDIAVNYWDAELDGKVKVTELGVIGSEIDLISDLGVDDCEGIPEIELGLRLGEKHQVWLSYFDVEYTGSKTLTAAVYFKGKTYSASTSVSSKLELSALEAKYGYSLLNRECLKLQPYLGIKYIEIDAELENSVVGAYSEEIAGPVPVVGLRTQIDFNENLSLAAELGGISVDVSDIDGKLLDGCVRLSYYFTENLGASVGYTVIDLDVESDDDSADVSVDGLFASTCARF